METTERTLSSEATSFVATAQADAKHAGQALRACGTLTGHGALAFAERIPNEDLFVILPAPNQLTVDQSVPALLFTFDGQQVGGQTPDVLEFGKLFARFPEISSAAHVHSSYLGAWSQTHQPLPIRYVPVMRWTLAKEIPSYVDHTQTHFEFIESCLAEDPSIPAILEANGGATVWGTKGLLALAEYIQILEEGAKLQLLAQAIGGSQTFGPGIRAENWKMSGLFDQAVAAGCLPD